MLTLVLIGSLIAAAVPVSAGTLAFSAQTIPTTTGKVIGTSSNVTDLAVYDADTIFAGNGTAKLLKTVNGGVSWSNITTTNNTDLVAVAPDDPDIIAIVDTTTLGVHVTTNGGTSWGDLGKPQETGDGLVTAIHDIAISSPSAGINYIAIAGEEGGATPFANVWTYNLGAAVPTWSETNDSSGLDADTVNSTAAAVAFSPNFASDQTMAVVTEEDDGQSAGGDDVNDKVYLELYSFNLSDWNSSAGYTGHSVQIVSDTAITDVTKASLSLAPDYNGSDDSLRLAFVGITLVGDQTYNGVHRVDDTAVTNLKIGTTIDVNSVAYDGTNLVAGRYDSNIVYRSANPTVTTPTVATAPALKRPGGAAGGVVYEKTVVAFAGTNVVAGTRGNESAFAVSKDDGKTFNDIALVDTTIGDASDVVLSADGSKIYLATDDGTDFSLWRKDTAWERVLSIQAAEDFRVRIAPDDADVVYVYDYQTTTMYYSSDAGETRWQTRTARYTIEDLAVEGSGDVSYALVAANGNVSKSTNAGFTWGTSKTSLLASGNMIQSYGTDKILATSANGYVSYSTTGGGAGTWTKIAKQVGSTAVEVVVTASGLDTDDYIYAALDDDDLGLYRWQIGTSAAWTTLHTDLVDECYGMALQDGILYVLVADQAGGDSTLYRTLSPTVEVPADGYFSTKTSTATLNTEPASLRATTDGILWSLDSEDEKLYALTDTLATATPTLTGPAEDVVVHVNGITGYAYDVAFAWERPSTSVTSYNLNFYDVDGYLVKSFTIASTSAAPNAVVGNGATNDFAFNPGASYTWKVRVSSAGPIYSGYTAGRAFTVAEAAPASTTVTVAAPAVTVEAPAVTVEAPAAAPAPVVTVQAAPAAPAPAVTVQAGPVAPPAVTVQAPAVTVHPPAVTVQAAAPAATAAVTPGWIYAIILVGAVLVIAVIVLIVRTRRVV